MKTSIDNRLAQDVIRYANCWEDADVLCEALAPRPGMRLLSIASGGDNVLALAAEGAEVVAADLNSAQLACLELKRAAFRGLDHPELLAFMGVQPSDARLAVYSKLRCDLPELARKFWDARPRLIETGIIHAGKFERYFQIFRLWLLPLAQTRNRIEQVLKRKSRSARRDFFDREWNRASWRLIFRLFFNRFMMGRIGRDPLFFQYVDGSVATRIMARTEHALAVLPTHENPYLQYILRGNFGPALPRYLRPEMFQAVRNGMGRITPFHGPIEEAAQIYKARGFDGFNLSDLFEYLSPDASRRLYGALLETGKTGARLAYWNMLVQRACPTEFTDRVRSLNDLAANLHLRDLAFFYSALVLEEVA